MAEIRHLENQRDVIFFCREWSDFDKISETGAEWHVDCGEVTWLKSKPDVEFQYGAFRRSKSISKPNFVEISQMEAEIYFCGNPKRLGKGSNFFSKSRLCQYPRMFCYILWIQNCIFDACRQRLHNSGLICNQATALMVVVEREKCPTPPTSCKRGGNCPGGDMSGEYVQRKCPDPSGGTVGSW